MSSEPTGFLYPFIEADERDSTTLLADLAASARSKIAESNALRATTHRAERGRAAASSRCGGSAASSRAVGCSHSATAGVPRTRKRPPSCSVTRSSGRSLAAMSLVDDRAVLTALANDVGFDLVFSRQLIAHARPGDIAMAFSTSGGSVNVLHALEEASRRELLTVGLSGYDGGAMATSGFVDHCLVVRSDSVHRIQETQDALVLELWSIVQRHLAEWARVVSSTVHDPGATGREAAVFDRIEAFRRRKSRLVDDVVTLAHGAGGKASAALLETVFLPAFAADPLAAQTDGAVITLAVG